MRCNEELLGRVEVEEMVQGRRQVVVPRHLMQWQTFSSGSAYMYAEVAGVTGSRGETKNIMCGCVAAADVTPSMRMIREEFRERIRSVFGDQLSVPMLFKIPTTMVAWENSGLVKAVPSDEGLMVSSEGTAIIDIIADMSRIGLFDGVVDRYTVKDIMVGFSYLHMIKPRYRSFVASDYGASASFEELLAHVPTDWFDLPRMLTLRSDVNAVGGVTISRVTGLPLFGEAFSKVPRDAGTPEFVQSVYGPVCSDSAVSLANTCVQFMPALDLNHEREWNTSSSAFPVDLFPGDAFIPAGPVLLRGRHLAVTFDPGVRVLTPHDVGISAPNGAVTVFLNGVVAVELQVVGDNHEYGFATKGVSTRMYQVHVVCESYAPGTPLGRWYDRRYAELSNATPYGCREVEFVLLSRYSVDNGNSLQLPFSGGVIADMTGVGTQVCELERVGLEARYVVAGPCMLKGGIASGNSDFRVVVDGVVDYGEAVALGVLDSAVLTVHYEFDVAMVYGCTDLTFPLTVKRSVPLNDYAIDRTELSDTDDDDYRIGTITDVNDPGFSVLSALLYASSRASTVSTVYSTGSIWTSMMYGLSYAVIAETPSTVARLLGAFPTVRDILLLDVRLLNVRVLEASSWIHGENGWYVALGDVSGTTWEMLAKAVCGGFRMQEHSNTLIGYLCTKYRLINPYSLPYIDSVCR